MRGRIRTAAAALGIAALLTALAGLGALERLDLAASDAWYQSRSAADPAVVLVGIDQRALEAIGPYDQWGRDVMAQAIEILNGQEDRRPAAIAVDVLYTGETAPAADQALADAAERYGNVIVAALAVFGDAWQETEKGPDLVRGAIMDLDLPYPALRSAAGLGHINAMLDTDGILRHHFLSLDLPDGTVLPSMALAAAERYWTYHGLTPPPMPETGPLGSWYIPFCGEPGDLSQSFSVADLLAGELDPGYFAGKIVLIGPYALGLRDSYPTSIDHAQLMHGVEIQANVIQALLRGEHKREAGTGAQLLALFLLLLACLIGFWKRPVLPSTILWAGVSAGWLLLCRLAYQAGWVLHVLWVPAGASVLYAGSLAANYVQAALARWEVTRRFKRYVAPEIVNEILAGGEEALALGGRRREIAVLFVDVRGFTAMSEKLRDDPERVVEILDRYLTLIAGCILHSGGTLDKFIGDAAMAFWNAPLAQEDYVMRAAQAALEMVQGASALAAELKELYQVDISFGIGIHTGPAVVGNMGSPQRMDYTAIGDTVNTASRLESNARGGEILISQAVVDALAGRAKTAPLDREVHLKGKEKEISIYTLEGIGKLDEERGTYDG